MKTLVKKSQKKMKNSFDLQGEWVFFSHLYVFVVFELSVHDVGVMLPVHDSLFDLCFLINLRQDHFVGFDQLKLLLLCDFFLALGVSL